METRYTLMFSYVLNNVSGYVIAPEGKEDVPESDRSEAWRTIITPLSSEAAYGKELPIEDMKKVAKELINFMTGNKGSAEFVGEVHRGKSCWGKKN